MLRWYGMPHAFPFQRLAITPLLTDPWDKMEAITQRAVA